MAGFQHVEVSRSYDATPEALWRVYTDHAGWKRWAGPAFRQARLQREGAPDPNGSGAVRAFGSGPLRALEEIVDFEPPARPGRGPRTRLVWRCRFRSRLPGLGPLLRIGIERLFRSVLEALARRFPAP
jgi:hypothetical protein